MKRLYHKFIEILPQPAGVRIEYLRKFKRMPNLENPQTFNEKLAWRKIFDKNPDFTLWSDKLWAKNKVSERLGAHYVLENLWTGKNPEEIPFESLTRPYVIKTNHASHTNIFVTEDYALDKNDLINRCKENLNYRFGKRTHEYHYLEIDPTLFIEPMMLAANGQPPNDFKFHVFDGEVEFIQVDADRFKEHKRIFYYKNWEKAPCSLHYPFCEEHIEAPKNLEEMITIAESLAAPFDYVRVDLYDFDGKVVFGEMTFTHGAGYEKFSPEHWDHSFGTKWILNMPKIP